MDDTEHDLFSGLLGVLRSAPERLNALWTGMRHALCRQYEGKDPYLLVFWLERGDWAADDPRHVSAVAAGIAAFHTSCWRSLRSAWTRERADEEAAEMLIDLYRDITTHLGKQVARDRRHVAGLRLSELSLSLLDAVHATVLGLWPSGDERDRRAAVVTAYESRREEMLAYLK